MTLEAGTGNYVYTPFLKAEPGILTDELVTVTVSDSTFLGYKDWWILTFRDDIRTTVGSEFRRRNTPKTLACKLGGCSPGQAATASPRRQHGQNRRPFSMTGRTAGNGSLIGPRRSPTLPRRRRPA